MKSFLNINVLDNIKFGTYPYGKDGEKAPIEWLVLDKKHDKVLLISEFGIDCQKYNKSFARVTWESCTLRKWLNCIFFESSFSKEEQKIILETEVANPYNTEFAVDGGNDTADKVFLLNINEAEWYLGSDEARLCHATPYAKSRGAYIWRDFNPYDEPLCGWWLRSPGANQYGAAEVRPNGSISKGGAPVRDNKNCIRPALWVKLT